jgi:hypothetical protein
VFQNAQHAEGLVRPTSDCTLRARRACAVAAQSKPNIVFMLANNLGYGVPKKRWSIIWQNSWIGEKIGPFVAAYAASVKKISQFSRRPTQRSAASLRQRGHGC